MVAATLPVMARQRGRCEAAGPAPSAVSSSRGCAGVSLYGARQRPPHLFADIRDTRKCRATSRSLAAGAAAQPDSTRLPGGGH